MDGYRRVVLVSHPAERLDPSAALDFVGAPEHGGIALFVGRVRADNQGRAVTGIDYQLYAPLTTRVLVEAADAARERHGPKLRVYLGHAHGRLSVGDLAVVVAAGAPHRDQAFRACRELIEAIKHEAPIWKREHFIDGSSAWAQGCSLCPKAGDAGPHPPAPVETCSHAGH